MGSKLSFRASDFALAIKVAQKLNAGTVRIDPRTGEITIEPHPRIQRTQESDIPRERIRL